MAKKFKIKAYKSSGYPVRENTWIAYISMSYKDGVTFTLKSSDYGSRKIHTRAQATALVKRRAELLGLNV